MTANVLGPDNAFWIDGEWLGWDSIIDPEETKFSRLAELEREAELRLKYPNADPTLVPYFQDLLTLAEAYFCDTGQHLNVYGDIGELFGAIMYGIKLHKNHAQAPMVDWETTSLKSKQSRRSTAKKKPVCVSTGTSANCSL